MPVGLQRRTSKESTGDPTTPTFASHPRTFDRCCPSYLKVFQEHGPQIHQHRHLLPSWPLIPSRSMSGRRIRCPYQPSNHKGPRRRASGLGELAWAWIQALERFRLWSCPLNWLRCWMESIILMSWLLNLRQDGQCCSSGLLRSGEAEEMVILGKSSWFIDKQSGTLNDNLAHTSEISLLKL